MRYGIAALLLAAGSVTAQDSFLQGEALQAAVSEQCKDGCLLLNRDAAEALVLRMQQFAEMAFQEGKKQGSVGCRI
jgi:hypothetical protein